MQPNIYLQFFNLSVSFRNLSEKTLSEIGLHSGQTQVLSALWTKDGMSQSEIAAGLGVSVPTVSSLVSKLQKEKFVKCRSCPRDKRLMRVYLTEKGFEIREQASLLLEKIEKLLLKDFSDTEKILLLMQLEKIKNNLHNELSES